MTCYVLILVTFWFQAITKANNGGVVEFSAQMVGDGTDIPFTATCEYIPQQTPDPFGPSNAAVTNTTTPGSSVWNFSSVYFVWYNG